MLLLISVLHDQTLEWLWSFQADQQGSSVNFRVSYKFGIWFAGRTLGICYLASEQPQLPWEELPQDCLWLLPGQCGWWTWTSPPAFRGWSWGIPGTQCLRSRWLVSKGTGSAACVSLCQPHSNEIRERMILPGPADKLCAFFSVSLIGVMPELLPLCARTVSAGEPLQGVEKKALVEHIMLMK